MKQKTALNILKTGRNVFLTGSAGTGKTYVLNQYINYLKERDIFPAILAPTGIAASHIGGNTIHSFFGLGIREKIDELFLDKILQKQKISERLAKLKVLIIDEVSMVSPEIFKSMDIILKTVKFNNKPFGGVQLILSGDFFQLPPISKEWKEIRFIWQTELWKKLDLKILYLEEKFRQKDKDILTSILDEIRTGDISQKTWEFLEKKIKEKTKSDINPTKLYTHNIDVDLINKNELKEIKEKSHFFEAFEKGTKTNIQKIYRSSLVQPKIELKKNAIVIFIKNNYEKNYINGTLGKVIDFDKINNNPIVKTTDNKIIKVEKEEWSIEDENGKVKALVKQIPLKLAWAITIHKSQGMSLDAAEIDLSKTFELGQGYVALSRVKSFNGLSLVGINNQALMVDQQVLWIDKKFKEKSKIIEKQFSKFKKEEKEKMYQYFIQKNGGIIDKKEIEKKKNSIKSFEEKKDSTTSFMLTKELIEKKYSLEKISETRELTISTIITHINRLVKNNLIDLKKIEYLKPDKEILDSVKEVLEEIIKDNNQEDFTQQNGKIKLSSIYNMLDKEIEYDDIKIALIFLTE